MKVWLDDVRPAPAGWVHARNVQQAQALLDTGQVTHLSLDHDLGGDGPDAYALCTWMAETNRWPAEWIGINASGDQPLQSVLFALIHEVG